MASYVAKMGLELDGTPLNDLGVSGYRGDNVRIGALGRFLLAIESRKIPKGSFLLIENFDRITRQNPWDALPTFQKIINAGIRIVTLQDEREYNLSTVRNDPSSLQLLFSIVQRANEESRTKSIRKMTSWAAKRKEASNKPMTARGPAWLKLDRATDTWEVVPERAVVVKRIFEMASSGFGDQSIAISLNKDNVPTWGDQGRAPATMWRKSYVAKILQSTSAMGVLVPQTTVYDDHETVRKQLEPIPNYYPRVIDDLLWTRVRQVKLSSTSRRGRHSAKPIQNVLGGLAKCSQCGATMTRIFKGKRQPIPKLLCTTAKNGNGCSYLPLSLEIIERSMLARFKSHIAWASTFEWDKVIVFGEPNNLAEIQEHEQAIQAIENDISLLQHERSRLLLKRLYDRLEDLKSVAPMRELGMAVSNAAVISSLSAVVHHLSEPNIDRAEVNLHMRRAFVKVDVHAQKKQLEFNTQSGHAIVLELN